MDRVPLHQRHPPRASTIVHPIALSMLLAHTPSAVSSPSFFILAWQSSFLKISSFESV
jgi:hypothetical protein